jgi:hypothetical protein
MAAIRGVRVDASPNDIAALIAECEDIVATRATRRAPGIRALHELESLLHGIQCCSGGIGRRAARSCRFTTP